MKDKNRLTIGFLIHHLDNDYSKALLKGASAAAAESDINLVIYPGRSLNCQLQDRKYTTFEYQHNVIYSYVSANALDAAVVSAGTIGSFVTKEEFKAFLDGFEGLPIVTTENIVRGYPCVRLCGSGIKDVISHLVKEHGRKHIAFVSGPKGNADADERLAYYREALEENGLEYDPEMVAYGRFSEYCVDLVGDLIDRNEGKIDAICFANDMMCKGGYKAIESRGLRVGKDISVTGYDDSEVAAALVPPLTTVRADASRLGYRAVKEAVKLAKTGCIDELTSLGSAPVIRSSCGCQSTSGNAALGALAGAFSADKLAAHIISEYVDESPMGNDAEAAIDTIRSFIAEVLEFTAKGDASREAVGKCLNAIGRLSEKQVILHIGAEKTVEILKTLRTAATNICSDDPAMKSAVYEIMERCLEAVITKVVSIHYNQMDDLTFTHFLINNITKDMTIYGSDEEKCYFSIVNNLYRIHMSSSFIYTYAEPIIHTNTMEWKRPNTIMLKSYHDGESLAAVTGDAQNMNADDFFCNGFTPTRRRTAIISPLFMNEEHYGIIVSEPEFEYFTYIYSITPQICTAIKLTKLVSQLETSLDAAQFRNSQLNRMSMLDELTGVYNRRGFYEFTNRIFKAPENEGKHAVLIFADLDNLKKINDNYGHDDGDYSIKSAADFIRGGLRNTDIVARIGGDEFAAFALCDNAAIIKTIPHRIKGIAAEHNLKSDKPYNVTVSIGIYELECSPTGSVQAYMDKADAALYADKKNKNPDILKH